MNVSIQNALSRRALLRGAGATLGLPFLEAMVPVSAAAGVAGRVSAAPQRFAFFYIPNGVVQDAWHPQAVGRGFEFTPSLKPLEGLRDHLNVFTGLDREFRGGTGVHAQAACSWLTSSPPSEALEGGFPTNKTLDQHLADHLGGETLLKSVELSCNNHGNARETKHFETISWLGPGQATTPEKDPRRVYNHMFGTPDPRDRKLLDLVWSDAKRLRGRLGVGDRDKLDHYIDSVRSVETRIERAEAAAAERGKLPLDAPDVEPEDRGEYIRLMGDLLVLAFQQDVTRVATMLVDPERWDTPRYYHGIFDKPQNHHVLTHTKGDEAKDRLQKIDTFHAAQFAYVLKRMAEIREGDGSLLDHSCLVLGSGMGDGRVHDYNNLPVITAGGLGGRLRTGEHHRFEGKVPVANLWLSLLHAAGVEREDFADSTGALDGIIV